MRKCVVTDMYRAKGKAKRGAISKKAQSNHTSIFTPTDDDPFHIFNVKYCTRAGLDILLRGGEYTCAAA